MAKSKPTKKTVVKPIAKSTNNKAKPAKTASPAKKDSKKEVKKPVVLIKKAGNVKISKAVVDTASKKIDQKKDKDVKKSPVAVTVKGSGADKNNAKANEKTNVKITVKSEVKADSKSDAKSKSKTKKPEKKAEDDFDEDLIGDDFGESEIAEYEEDLKAVEDEDDDTALEITDDDDTEVKDEEVYLTDSEGRRLCRVRDCDQVSTVEGYCRYHYLLLWKKIQIRKHILIDNKLEKYIEDLMARYPDKFLEVVKKDLKTEKDFISVIQEMELDDSVVAENDNEDEVQSFADEIRGIGDAPSMDDDGDF